MPTNAPLVPATLLPNAIRWSLAPKSQFVLKEAMHSSSQETAVPLALTHAMVSYVLMSNALLAPDTKRSQESVVEHASQFPTVLMLIALLLSAIPRHLKLLKGIAALFVSPLWIVLLCYVIPLIVQKDSRK